MAISTVVGLAAGAHFDDHFGELFDAILLNTGLHRLELLDDNSFRRGVMRAPL